MKKNWYYLNNIKNRKIEIGFQLKVFILQRIPTFAISFCFFCNYNDIDHFIFFSNLSYVKLTTIILIYNYCQQKRSILYKFYKQKDKIFNRLLINRFLKNTYKTIDFLKIVKESKWGIKSPIWIWIWLSIVKKLFAKFWNFLS